MFYVYKRLSDRQKDNLQADETAEFASEETECYKAKRKTRHGCDKIINKWF